MRYLIIFYIPCLFQVLFSHPLIYQRREETIAEKKQQLDDVSSCSYSHINSFSQSFFPLFVTNTHSHSLSLSLSYTRTISLSHSLSHTHITHTHITHKYTLSHTHTQFLSLSLSHTHTHTHTLYTYDLSLTYLFTTIQD